MLRRFAVPNARGTLLCRNAAAVSTATRHQQQQQRQSLSFVTRVTRPNNVLSHNMAVARFLCSSNLNNHSSGKGSPDDVNPAPATTTKGSRNTKKSKLVLYADLTKARLSSLVVLPSGAGFLCAGAPVDWMMMAGTCVGTGLCAASAGTFNQMIERHQDAAMNRTKLRPLPSGQVSMAEASLLGVGTGMAGTALLYGAANPVVAALGAFNIFLYAGPYTLSKRYTEWNTWVGSLVGAVPPVMGYAAASGGVILAAEPLALASLLFLWQFPHFFALSWMHREDYARGGFAMVAVNDPHGRRSADLIWEYSLYLSALPILASATGLTSWMFAVEGTAANLYLLSLAHAFRQDSSNAKARRVFMCSLWYLPLLLAGYVFHSRMWEEQKDALGLEDKADQGGMLAEARQRLRGICVHEMVAAYNTNNSNNSSSSSSGEKEEGDSSDLCVKLKAGKVLGSATAHTSKVVTAAVEEVQSQSQTQPLPLSQSYTVTSPKLPSDEQS